MKIGVEMTRNDFFIFWKKIIEVTALQIHGRGYARFAIKNDKLLVSANSRVYNDTDYLGYIVSVDRSLVHLLPENPEELKKDD